VSGLAAFPVGQLAATKICHAVCSGVAAEVVGKVQGSGPGGAASPRVRAALTVARVSGTDDVIGASLTS
jgi:hypothetical protein